MALSGYSKNIMEKNNRVCWHNISGLTFNAPAGKSAPKMGWQRMVCVLMVALISGCVITKDYQRPSIDVPDKWRMDYQTSADLSNTAWWDQFHDPVLSEMIGIALAENKDIRIATARIEEFAGKLQAAKAGFFPQINYGVLGSRNHQSSSRPTPELLGGSASDGESDAYKPGITASWELDVWGRIRRASEAGRADLLSAEEGRQAVILELVSNVVLGYIKLLCLDKQLLYYNNTLTERKESVDLFDRKYIGGLVSGLDIAQIKGGYEQVAEYVPDTESQIAKMENNLSVLLGRNPGTIKRGKPFDALDVPEVPQGIPSDILMRRPDIRQCEQNLIAANARIGVARTQYFPRISLTGLLGYSSTDITTLLDNASNFWQAGAAALGTIFDGGHIEGEVRQAAAVYQQLLNVYLSAIQNAFREVNDCLMDIQKLQELLKIQERHLAILNDNIRFARSRYEAKLTSSYFEVMDAEKNLFFVETNSLITRYRIFEAMVNIYKVMGGGWVTDVARQIQLLNQKTEPANQAPYEDSQADTLEEGIFNK